MKIWGRANSINVMKVLWAADECGIKYDRTDVGGAFGGNDQKWYLDMNPNGVVPTIDDGGRVIWESNSAVRYLSAKYAAGTLWPNDPGQRSDADRWMDWQLSTISEAMRICFWGLIRTPAEKRDMAAIKKAAEDAGRLFGGSTIGWKAASTWAASTSPWATSRSDASSIAGTRSTSSARSSRTCAPGTSGSARARPTPSTSWSS